jgi:hypothetical protein
VGRSGAQSITHCAPIKYNKNNNIYYIGGTGDTLFGDNKRVQFYGTLSTRGHFFCCVIFLVSHTQNGVSTVSPVALPLLMRVLGGAVILWHS